MMIKENVVSPKRTPKKERQAPDTVKEASAEFKVVPVKK